MRLHSIAAVALLWPLACTGRSPQESGETKPGTQAAAMDAGAEELATPDAGAEALATPDAGAPDAGPLADRPSPDRVFPAPKLIPGSYIVLFKELKPDGKPVKAGTEARRLAKKYGGKITFIYDSLPGFAIEGLSEEKAEALKKEPLVLVVDQDRAMQMIGPIKTKEPRQ